MTEWDSSPEGKAYHKKAQQEWREKNREKSNEYHREYMKAWRELNKDRAVDKAKLWVELAVFRVRVCDTAKRKRNFYILP